MNRLYYVIPAFVLTSCVSPVRVSHDPDQNYAFVFNGVRQPQPVIVNSRLDRFTKTFGPWQGAEQNGLWEFEIRAPKPWGDEIKTNFVPAAFEHSFRKPDVDWWKPDPGEFDTYRMQHSSHPAAHLFVERHPKDQRRIHVFIQRY